MKVQDDRFPPTYAQATWPRLAPFFRLPGRVVGGAATVVVELRPFNDRSLNRDLAAMCANVREAQPQLPDGRRLLFFVGGARSLTVRCAGKVRCVKSCRCSLGRENS